MAKQLKQEMTQDTVSMTPCHLDPVFPKDERPKPPFDSEELIGLADSGRVFFFNVKNKGEKNYNSCVLVQLSNPQIKHSKDIGAE